MSENPTRKRGSKDGRKTSGSREPSPGDEQITALVQEVLASPERADLWTQLEELAAESQRPDDVASAYREVLGRELPPVQAESLGQRAMRFHEEWFGESSAELVAVLQRVTEISPAADWALRRLIVVLSVGERWDEVLAAYDRALGAVSEQARRRELLDEAAHIAKDFVGRPDRAIGYLQQLVALRPSDVHLAASLERLLEKQERYNDLIDLWRVRLPVLPPDEARDARLRIAACLFERLGNPGASLHEVQGLLQEPGDDAQACRLLERILGQESAPAEIRIGALNLLRTRYEVSDRAAELIAALNVALGFSTGDARAALHREAGEREASRGEIPAAQEHFVSLLGLTAGLDVQDRLRRLSEMTQSFEPYARGLAQAAGDCRDGRRRVALLMDAAGVQERLLHDTETAVSFYSRVVAEPEAESAECLTASRHLADLLEHTERRHERLAVLERLASLEPRSDDRRLVLAQAARLAAELDQIDRAVAAWENRLQIDALDQEALDSLVALLDRAARWEPLIGVLRRRVSAPVPAHQRRADLVRIAGIQATHLASPQAAIDTWLEIQRDFGEDTESVDALSDLFAVVDRWSEQVELLIRAGERDAVRLTRLLCRLGDSCRERLKDGGRAAAWYRRALEIDPQHAGARAGLQAVLDDPAARAEVVAALEAAFRRTDDWQAALSIMEARIELAGTPVVRAAVCREAATLSEMRAQDKAAALRWLRRAFALVPEDLVVERELLRLADETQDAAGAVEALREAAAAVQPGPRLGQLRSLEAGLLERRLNDAAGALEAYQVVLKQDPGRTDAREGLVRSAARCGRWELATRTSLQHGIAREQIEKVYLPMLEEVAAETGGWDGLCGALDVAVSASRWLEPSLARELQNSIARWHRDRRQDVEASEAALARAVGFDASHAPTVKMLAALQRRTPGRQLLDTLLKLHSLVPDDLDALHEAATLALGPLADPAAARQVLSRLVENASRLLRTGTAATGNRAADTALLWAIEQLEALLLSSGAPADAARAAELLIESAWLPVGAEPARAMRMRAAGIAVERLRDRARAITAYRNILDATPGEPETAARLGALYEEDGRLADLLALRKDELDRCQDAERRLALRLEFARVAGMLEEKTGRVDLLRVNLKEQPGHEASVNALAGALEARQRFPELGEMLEQQAAKLEERAEVEHSARLWARAAAVAEQRLADPARALQDYSRVAALVPTPEALDALGRLTLDGGDPLGAAGWYERRLETAEGAARVETSLRLARAYLAAGQRHRAVACLERCIGEDPTAESARTDLAGLYRTGEMWEPLARLLSDACAHTHDNEVILAHAREAAEIYQRLGTPDRAVPVLERAVALLPGDRWLRTLLAEGLRVAGRLDDARRVLQGLLDDAGRRRSRERASVHHALAQVERAQGHLPEAIEQLEQASGMDMSNAAVLELLAEVAEEAGQLERAERAYRALLLVLRREPNAVGQLSTSEILLHLHRIAIARGESDKAGELLDSALAAAVQDANEARRLQKALLERKESEVLLGLLGKRLEAAEDAASQAEVLEETAAVQQSLGRDEPALDALLRAIELAPDRVAGRKAARTLAAKLGATSRFIEKLVAVADRRRRRADAALVAEVLLDCGHAAEQDLADLSRARELYQRAEATTARQVECWGALARVAQALGDGAEQSRVLRLLVEAAGSDASVAMQADAHYRLAELYLSSPDTRVQGLDHLAAAFEREPQFERALGIVRAAQVPDSELPRVLPLYERVARASKDDHMLLDFLARRAALPQATPAEVREGVDLALTLGDTARAETLLIRAVDLARGMPEGLREAAWAPLQLVQLRKAAGDLPAAADWLREAAPVSDPARVSRLCAELAEQAAGPAGNLGLAAEMYRRMLDGDPGNRVYWQPLLDIYARLGDEESLERLIGETLPRVEQPSERNLVRMTRAKFLLGRNDSDSRAVDALRDVLMEEAGHLEATALLADLFVRTGDDGELAALLEGQLQRARPLGDTGTVVALARRLGELRQKTDVAAARLVYEDALQLAPRDRDLLAALFALFPADEVSASRASIIERLLAEEEGTRARDLALDLAGLRRALGDDDGVRRALEQGVSRCGAEPAILEQLEAWYRERGAWEPLANLLAAEGREADRPEDAAHLLREAAVLQSTRLQQPARAVELMREARGMVPQNVELLKDLASMLNELGDSAGAIEEVTRALEQGGTEPAVRVELLLLRAELLGGRGEDEAAVRDLESAYAAGGAPLAADLIEGLERWRGRAAAAEQRDAERRATLRLVDVLGSEGRGGDARDLLASWTDREPQDREALRALRVVDQAANRWDDVIQTCARLIGVEEGDAQVDAACGLADACEQVGRAADALPGLEHVRSAQPGSAVLFTRLQQLYAAAGAHRQLAELLHGAAAYTEDAAQRLAYLRQAGELYLTAGDAAAASLALREALTIQPDSPELLMLLVDTYIAAGYYNETAELLSPMIAAHKGHASVELAALQYRMSRVAAGLGDRKVQMEWLKRALESDKKNGVVAAELADLAEEMQDFDMAIKALRAVTLYNSPGPLTPAMAFLRQARIAFNHGEKPKAIIFTKRALQEDPKYQDATDFLKSIE